MLPVDIASFEHMNTKNLILRKATIRDVDDIFEIRHNPRIFRYIDNHIDETKEVTKSYLARMNKGQENHKWIIWVIECKDDRKTIGTICLSHMDDKDSSATVSFVMHPDYQGKGYIQEALDTVTMISFDKLGLKKLISVADSENVASISLLENTDFQFCETFQEYHHGRKNKVQLYKYVLKNHYNFL